MPLAKVHQPKGQQKERQASESGDERPQSGEHGDPPQKGGSGNSGVTKHEAENRPNSYSGSPNQRKGSGNGETKKQAT